MKMAGSCDATNGDGRSHAPMIGWDSSADCWYDMSICWSPIELSSISHASGSRCGNVYETRSSQKRDPDWALTTTRSESSNESEVGNYKFQVDGAEIPEQREYWPPHIYAGMLY